MMKFKKKLIILLLAVVAFAATALFATACSTLNNQADDSEPIEQPEQVEQAEKPAPDEDDIISEQTEQTEQPEQPVTRTYSAIYTVNDNIGGTIEGEATQSVDEGTACTTVTAVADEGFRFTGWSDGVTTAQRTDLNVSADIEVYAQFIRVYTVTFTSEGGGNVDGETTQTVDENTACTTVTAVADIGYKFVCWSTGDTDASITYTPTQENNLSTIYAIFNIEELDLPIMLIETKNGEGITSKEEYVKCNVSVINTDESYQFETSGYNDKIRGRGNTSWSQPQKSYKLKFNSKTNLFGNDKAKTWTLIANYIDKSLIRNYLAYSIGSLLGSNSGEKYSLSETTTTTQFIELYVNGEYLGVYLVCEQNETGSTRIDIEDEYFDSNGNFVDPSKVGYLLEMDRRIYPDQTASAIEGLEYFVLEEQYYNAYSISTPDYEDLEDLGYDMNDIETLKKVFEPYVTYIDNWMTTAYIYLSDESTSWETITKYFDVNSFAQSYVTNELFKTVDCNYSSFYVFKTPDTDTEGGKLYCGPIWDYDLSSGNCGYNDTEYTDNLYASYANCYYTYLLKHDEFVEIVKDILTEYDSAIRETISQDIDYVYANSASFLRHFEKWSEELNSDTNPTLLSNAVKAINTWEGQVEYLRVWLLASLSYMEYYYLAN